LVVPPTSASTSSRAAWSVIGWLVSNPDMTY
jgi:hypothetical protein